MNQSLRQKRVVPGRRGSRLLTLLAALLLVCLLVASSALAGPGPVLPSQDLGQPDQSLKLPDQQLQPLEGQLRQLQKELNLSEQQVDLGGQEPRVAAEALSGTPGQRIMLCVHVDLQGRPPRPNGTWKRKVDIIMISFERLPLLYWRTVQTNAWGDFCLPNIAPGRVYVWVKAADTVAACKTVNIASSSGTMNLNMGTLYAGDANDDNRITLVDKAIVVAAYPSTKGQKKYNARADFNDDNKVDSVDLGLVNANLGRVGCSLLPW